MVEETPAVVQKYYQICKCGHTRFSHKLFADGCDAIDCNCIKFEKSLNGGTSSSRTKVKAKPTVKKKKSK